MKCPNCGTENLETSRFCGDCGYQFTNPTPEKAALPIPGPTKIDPIPQLTLFGGITGMVGGGLTFLGWLLPWVSLMSAITTLLRNLGNFPSSLNFSIGGNGLQIFLISLVGGFACFSSKSGLVILLGLLLLVVAGVLLTIPILATLILRTGFKVFEMRLLENDPSLRLQQKSYLQEWMEIVKKRSTTILTIMLIIFILAAALPFVGIGMLSGGFYLTIIGALIAFAVSYYIRIKLRDYKP